MVKQTRISVAAMQMKQNRRRIKKEDRISSLPESLLTEIISRLPSTKQAIRTGILSKRWKNLWTEVRNLIFIHRSEVRTPEFLSYIEKVLRLRGQSNLNKFRLDIPYNYGIDKKVNNWIRYAFSCNVQDLNLLFLSDFWGEPYQSDFVLDQFFFVNSSFTHMKLDGCVFKPTGAISWTNLKSLCIVRGNLDENLIKNILSGSPLLETLNLQNCAGFLRIDITSKGVKNLVFAGYEYYWDDVVEINAPHILSLTIEKELVLRKVVLLNVSSLVEAKLNYCESDEPIIEDESDEPTSDDEKEEMLKGLILSLRHVKNLKIGCKCQEVTFP